jgi:hypothetical protein
MKMRSSITKGSKPSDREIARAVEIVAKHLAECWIAWRMYHP